jgi:hypothetical protein
MSDNNLSDISILNSVENFGTENGILLICNITLHKFQPVGEKKTVAFST